MVTKIKFTQSVLHFRRGGEYELPDGVANVYLRRGLAVLAGLPPMVATKPKPEAKATGRKRGK